MDKFYSQLVRLPVITSFGNLAGYLRNIIIKPETGKVVAFNISAGRNKIVVPIDVLGVGLFVEITDNDAVLDVEDVMQVKQVIASGIKILGQRVETQEGQFLGHVLDYAINDKLFVLTKILVTKSILGLVSYDKKIIAHKDIIKITPKAIIVKNPLRLTPLKQKKLDPLKKLNVDAASI